MSVYIYIYIYIYIYQGQPQTLVRLAQAAYIRVLKCSSHAREDDNERPFERFSQKWER
jgi:hypothetical protein